MAKLVSARPPALIKRLLKGAAVGAVLKFGGAGLAFLMLLVLAQAMTLEQYGIFAAAFSLATIAGFVATLGQHVSILRFWPSVDEVHGRRAAAAALRFSLRLTLGGAAVVVIGFALFGLVFPQSAMFGGTGLTLTLIGLMAGAFALSETIVAGLRARGSVIFALGPREIAWRLLVIGVALTLSSPLGAEVTLAVVTVALLTVTAPQLFLLGREALAAPRTPASVEDAAAMRGSVLDFWGGGAVGPLSAHVGTIIVGVVLGPISAGAYFAADRIAKLLSIALIGVNQIVGPMIARSWRGGRIGEVRLLVLAASGVSFVVACLGFIAYLLFGKFALSLFDPSYVEAFSVLLILSGGQLVNTICGPVSSLLLMIGRERENLIITIVWGVVTCLSIIGAGHYYGLLGSATASALCLSGWNLSCLAVALVHISVRD